MSRTTSPTAPPGADVSAETRAGATGHADGSRPFWETTPLAAMSDAEWESLCDGCGRCCLQKLEDEDTGEVHFTRVACRLLDTATARCRHYADRRAHVEDCLEVRPLDADKRGWLPASCAYRRLAEGRGLADWHPLVSGDPGSVVRAGIAVAGRVVSERDVPVHELIEHLIVWHDETPSPDGEG